MDKQLKNDADALWDEVMSQAGRLERGALTRRKGMLYELIGKHFGSAYNELAALKGGQGQ